MEAVEIERVGPGTKTTEEMVREMYVVFMEAKQLLDLLKNNPQEFFKTFMGENPMLNALFG